MNRRPFIILGLLLWLPALAEPQGDSGPPADILAVRNIEITFHTAGSVLPNKDLDLMMSLYADDAVLTDTAHDRIRRVERILEHLVKPAGAGDAPVHRAQHLNIAHRTDFGQHIRRFPAQERAPPDCSRIRDTL